jgi:hypothetical protein
MKRTSLPRQPFENAGPLRRVCEHLSQLRYNKYAVLVEEPFPILAGSDSRLPGADDGLQNSNHK